MYHVPILLWWKTLWWTKFLCHGTVCSSQSFPLCDEKVANKGLFQILPCHSTLCWSQPRKWNVNLDIGLQYNGTYRQDLYDKELHVSIIAQGEKKKS